MCKSTERHIERKLMPQEKVLKLSLSLSLSLALGVQSALMKGEHYENRLGSHTLSHLFIESFPNCLRMRHNLSILLVSVGIKSHRMTTQP